MYTVAPGLRPFGTDFGNQNLDQVVFQFDAEFVKYRRNKLACLAERTSKYVVRSDLDPLVEKAVVQFIRSKLVGDWPNLFDPRGDNLWCNLTQELVQADLGELLLQIEEDLAIVQVDGDRDWISYLNLCSPSHWSPEVKAGKSFFDAHVPVPGFERVNAVSKAMIDSMIHRGPFVRFVWTLESDDRLNHHPEAPPGVNPADWYGRQFERGWVIRTERQISWGLPEVNAAMFFIRVGFVSAEVIRSSPGLWDSLLSAIRTMPEASLNYKGASGFLEKVFPSSDV